MPIPEDQIVVIIRNITERKRTEETLRETADKFRFVFENAYDGISVFEETSIREQRRLIDCNKRYTEMAGRNREELLQIGTTKSIAKTLSVDNHESIAHDIVFGGSFSWIRPDGKDNVIEYTAVPIKVGEKTITIGIDRDITERKRTEDELRESEERYRRLVEVSPDAVAVHANGRIVYVNPAVVKLLRAHDESELIGKPVLDIIHPDYKELVRRQVSAAMEQGIAQPMEVEKFLCLDGTVVDVEVVSVSTTFKGMLAVQVVIRNITERKQAEETLRRERNLFRVLIDNLPDAIYVKDTECRKTIANKADVYNMGRQSEAEVLGKTDFDLYPADIAAGFYADDLAVIRSGKSVINKEEFFFDKDGKKDWLLTVKLPMRDEQGRIIGLVGIGREITEQKRAMEALTLLSHTVKSIGESISITDLKNNLLFVNEAFLKTYGYTEQEIMGKPIDIVSSDPITQEQTILAETIKGGWQGELLNRKKDGTIFPIHLSTSIVYDENEQPIGLVGVATDITESKRAEEALRETNEKLRNIVENSTNLFYSRNTNQVFTYLSPQAKDIFDCEPDEALVNFTDFMTDNSINKLGCELAEKAVQTGARQETYELELLSRKGRRVWVEIQEAPVVKDGKTISIVGAATDITERRWAEMALQVSEKKYRDIVTWAPVGIYQSTLSGKLLSGIVVLQKCWGMMM